MLDSTKVKIMLDYEAIKKQVNEALYEALTSWELVELTMLKE